MQCPSYAVSEITKKAIKAALKLCACMHPSSKTPDSTRPLISRDFKTWRESEKVKIKESCEKIRCMSDPCHLQQQQLLKQ